jgi:hypothetical protein
LTVASRISDLRSDMFPGIFLNNRPWRERVGPSDLVNRQLINSPLRTVTICHSLTYRCLCDDLAYVLDGCDTEPITPTLHLEMKQTLIQVTTAGKTMSSAALFPPCLCCQFDPKTWQSRTLCITTCMRKCVYCGVSCSSAAALRRHFKSEEHKNQNFTVTKGRRGRPSK